jgi:hypothetical protein
MAVVDFPDPPFSLPQTMTCALPRFFPSEKPLTPDKSIDAYSTP